MEFTREEVEIIYNALIQFPYNQVKAICEKIENNVNKNTK